MASGVSFFEVTKPGLFKATPRVIVLELPSKTPLGTVDGEMREMDTHGVVRHVVAPGDLLAVEKLQSSKKEDVEATVRYLTASKTSAVREVADTYTFACEKDRDAFVGQLVALNRRVNVTNRHRGMTQVASLAPDRGVASLRSRKGPTDSSSVDMSASPRRGSADVSADAATDAVPAAALRRLGTPTFTRRFFVMQENNWGFYQPRVVSMTDGGVTMNLIDSNGVILAELTLLQLRGVALHAVDDTAMLLSFAIGDGISTTRQEYLLTVGTPAQREDFLSALIAATERAVVSSSTSKDSALPWDVRRTWADPLPRNKWHRFDVLKVAALKNAKFTMLMNVKERVIHYVKTKDLDKLENKGSIIPDDIPIDSTTSVAPGECQTTRDRRYPRRVKVSFTPFAEGFARSATSTVFELTSKAQRELFIAVLAHMAIVPANMPQHLSTVPADSVAQLPITGAPSLVWGAALPHDNASVFVGSWNVSSAGPPDDLSGFVPHPTSAQYDVFAIGLQEVGSSGNRDSWGKALELYLNTTAPSKKKRAKKARFVKVATESMWELVIWVYIKAKHVADVTNVTTGYEATGLSLAKGITNKQLGNKGGVGVSFVWRDTPLCFLNTHLAAKPSRIRQRESDFKQICERLRLDPTVPGTPVDFVRQHDHVWWFGDLNYRTDLPFDETVALANEGRFDEITAHDQLLVEQGARRVFAGFTELPRSFLPTYRWIRDSVTWSNKNDQSPSYTDRIMLHSLPGVADRVTAESLASNNEMFGSDHRPVIGAYTLRLPKRFTLPVLPRRHVPSDTATMFFLDGDAPSTHHAPTFALRDVKVVHANTFTSPDSMRLSVHAAFLERAVVAPAVAAVRPSRVATRRSGSVIATPEPAAGGDGSPPLRRAPLIGVESSREAILDPTSPSNPGVADVVPASSMHNVYKWENTVPLVVPIVWDPRYLIVQHLHVVLEEDSGAGAVGVFGAAAVPLRPVCEALCGAVEALRGAANVAGAGEGGGDPAGIEGLNSDPAWALDPEDGVPKCLKLPGVPFSVPILVCGQPVANLEGEVVVRSGSAVHEEGATNLLGAHWNFASAAEAGAGSASPFLYNPDFGGSSDGAAASSGSHPSPQDLSSLRAATLLRLPPHATVLASTPSVTPPPASRPAKPTRVDELQQPAPAATSVSTMLRSMRSGSTVGPTRSAVPAARPPKPRRPPTSS